MSEIELIIFDFDGVFTDNTVYVSQSGEESVKCWRGDGLGINRLKSIGIKIYIVSSETNPVVNVRANKLKVDCFQGVENKSQAVLRICNDNSIPPQKVMFVGNDVNDIPAFNEVGIAAGVADSHEDVYAHVEFLTKKKGGKGAVREICDLVFNAKKRITQ